MNDLSFEDLQKLAKLVKIDVDLNPEGVCVIKDAPEVIWDPLEKDDQCFMVLASLIKEKDCELLYDDGYYFIYQFTDHEKELLTYQSSLNEAIVKAVVDNG